MCDEARPIHILIAAGKRGEIGTNSGLPWGRLAADMSRFRRITRTTFAVEKKNVVIMGRRTWESIGGNPLPGRINVILSRRASEYRGRKDVVFVPTVSECCALVDQRADVEMVFLIGGSEVIKAFMQEAPARLSSLNITHVMAEYPRADTFVDLPALEAFFPLLFYRTVEVDPKENVEVEFVLRWPLLSDI